MAHNKDLKNLVKSLEDQGWTTRDTRKGLYLLAPDGVGAVLVHYTNSDHRAWKNTLAEIRRAGGSV